MSSLDPEEPAQTYAGVSIESLATAYGTPLYVYDGDRIAAHVEEMRRALTYTPSKIFYSAKANASVAIAALARQLGLGLDACSPGDLLLAQRAGFEASEITYTGFGSTDDELRLAAARAATIVADDISEIERIAALGMIDEVGLRVNPGIDAGFHAHVMAGARESKFGIQIEELSEALRRATAAGLRVTGLHAHIGSDVLDASIHVELLRTLADVAHDKHGLHWINLGGGWGTPRRRHEPEYDWEVVDAAAHETLGGDLELRLEPGGYVLMDAGVVTTRVIAVKPRTPDRVATVVVDANTNHLISALLYSAHHPVARVADTPAPTREYRIVGNLMQAGDVLVPTIALPEIQVGDLLLLGHVGAYAASRAGTFNERPRPAEVLVRQGVATLIRRRETADDLFSRDLPLEGDRVQT